MRVGRFAFFRCTT